MAPIVVGNFDGDNVWICVELEIRKLCTQELELLETLKCVPVSMTADITIQTFDALGMEASKTRPLYGTTGISVTSNDDEDFFRFEKSAALSNPGYNSPISATPQDLLTSIEPVETETERIKLDDSDPRCRFEKLPYAIRERIYGYLNFRFGEEYHCMIVGG
ncbi:hypothetical protein K432DRAFT_397713 [Lepidopterella palustris CBS 459.81]|uniref:Uncharacterized protein n=1 Tax=Lepidopterella palustris CBS 459.81 TaxID=1314670 RepID=A0A8E2JA19_9PEZI|nr:hypothetical protein K432DRAFT_397713 [Lepidopterella palustris CBS 459.81]